jgi:hypothetical protein
MRLRVGGGAERRQPLVGALLPILEHTHTEVTTMKRSTRKTFRRVGPSITVHAWDELRRYTTYHVVLATKAAR